MPSIHLHDNFISKQFSTNLPNSHSRHPQSELSVSSSRCSRSREFGSLQKKVYNLNDQDRRLRREHHPIFQNSCKQSDLFERGIKKVKPSHQSAPKSERDIPRSYRNNQTYDVLHPTSQIQNKIIVGGRRKICLYDESKSTADNTKKSQKKIIKDFNQTIAQENDFYIKKVPTGVKSACSWGNSHCGVKFNRKQNQMNKENLNHEQTQKETKKTIKLTYQKNKSSIIAKECGIVIKEAQNKIIDQKGIDFSQQYYKSRGSMKNLLISNRGSLRRL